ncbi:MAG: DUF3488 and transglutaminase-like domain-containing protein [Oligoflexia bacterium]|nr:DUF3488 and transglutaminase-like domain-containing protein [Oligoflexia bacterium]
MQIKVTQLQKYSIILCELVGILGLFLAKGEVWKELSIFLFVFFMLRIFIRKKLPAKLAVFVGAVAVLSSICVYFFSTKENAEFSLVYLLIILQGILLFSKQIVGLSFWRLLLAFLSLLLGVVLYPEPIMFLLFIFFAIGCSVGLISTYLSLQQYLFKEEIFLDRSILLVILLSGFIIFTSSMGLFFILPRSDVGNNIRAYQNRVGYSEEIDLSSPTAVWRQGNERIVMSIQRSNSHQLWEELIPYGLVRGKTLGVYNGKMWTASAKNSHIVSEVVDKEELYISRNRLMTEVLPTTYRYLSLDADADAYTLSQYSSGELISQKAYNNRIFYRLSSENKYPLKLATDTPRKIHYKKTNFEKHARVVRLAKEIFSNEKNPKLLVRKIDEYFSKNKFSAQLVPQKINSKEDDVLTNFMFRSRVGHCELFASAAALLLREAGIATRIISGFRVSPKEDQNILSVKNTQAHAWVEFWDGNQWLPYDPTPATPIVLSRWEWLDGLSDISQIYWDRYILNYELNFFQVKEMLKKNSRSVYLILFFIIVFISYIKIKASISRRKKKSAREIFSEDFYKIIYENEKYSFLKNRYLEARFCSDLSKISEFRSLFAKVKKESIQ